MKKLIIAILVSSLLVFASCKSLKPGNTSTPASPSTSEKELQSQIDSLNSQIYALNSVISKFQLRIKTLETSGVLTTPTVSTTPVIETTTPVIDKGPSEIEVITDSINRLTTSVRILQEDVMTLHAALRGAATNIGTTSMTVNGLSVTFITNNIDIGMTGSTIAGVAQFAIKISNMTDSIVSNLDVTGTITSSQYIAGNMANNYPQVTDASTLFSIAYSYSGGNTVNFEAYGGSKSLSIPVGGSITLRPKISIMATVTNRLAATTFTVALNAITYDVGVIK
jgi:hypothetical protein